MIARAAWSARAARGLATTGWAVPRRALVGKCIPEKVSPVGLTQRWRTPGPWTGQLRGLSDRRDEEEERRRQKEQAEAEKPSGLFARGAGAVATGAILFAGKTKWVLGALKFTKMMPALSMLASTGAYAFFYGWPFAVGMVGQIAVHEAGHLAAMKFYGIPAGPMVFIPFMGAAIEMKDRPKDVKEEAVVAFGGPIVGGAAAVALSAIGIATESQMLIALADFGIMINLFNLMPIGSLDGGRIGGAISPWFLAAGLAGGVAAVVNGMIHNPIFFLILMSGGFSTYDRFFGGGTHDSYYRIPGAQRAALTAGYVALIVALIIAMAWNQSHKKSLRQLRLENPDRGLGEMGSRLDAFAEEWKDDPDEEARRLKEMEQDFVARHFQRPGDAPEAPPPSRQEWR